MVCEVEEVSLWMIQGKVRKLLKSIWYSFDLKLWVLGEVTTSLGREFHGIITREEKKNLCVLVLARGIERRSEWPRVLKREGENVKKIGE